MGASQLPVMRVPSIRHCRLVTLIIAAAASGFYFGCFWTMSAHIPLSLDACDPHTSDIDFLRDIAKQLDEALLELNGCRCSNRALLALHGALALLDPRHALSAEEVLLRAQHEKQRPAVGDAADACGEVYTGGRGDEGFVTAPDCRPQDKPPLEKLVTAVMLAPSPLSAAPDAPLDALRQHHPRLPAVVAVPAVATKNTNPPAHDKTTVVSAGAREFAIPGALLNRLVRRVSSSYALLVRDAVRVDELARLQRLVYVISALGDRRNGTGGGHGSKGGADAWGIAVAGGAVRDAQGHWSAGCAQTTLRNYALRVKHGYRFSALDCMLCDQLRGPFLARTSLLREVPFSEHLPTSVVFEDWFLRAKRHGALAAACPDSLFFVGGDAEGVGGGGGEEEERGAWRQLAAAWQVDRVLLPGRPPLRFSCKEVGFHCDLRVWQNKSLLNPTCCVAQLTGAFAAFDLFAARHKFDYELNDGTALGAVKLQNALPWDIDGDIFIVLEDFEKYKDAKGEMSAQGYLFKDFMERKGSKYFIFYTPEISIDMWCRKILGTSNLPKEMQYVPTRIKMMNKWMRSPWNPGYFVRNRYGPGYLKHAQHWRNLGFKDQYTTYSVGSWKNCSLPNHHACLNRYPPDGSFNLLPEDFH